MKEKIFLLVWLLGCLVFFATLDSQTLRWVYPAVSLKPVLLLCLGTGILFLFFPKKFLLLQHPLFVFPIPVLAMTFVFLMKFPPERFSSIIFQDDFTSLYAASLRTLRMMREGTLFGWDSSLLGGYHTVSDLNFNLGLFLWPFYLCFSPPVGYHLFIFYLYLLFPVLVYWLARLHHFEKAQAAIAFWLSSFFAISFFRNVLLWGNIDNVLGLDLFLLVLICLKKSEKSHRAFFALALTGSLLAYAHLAYFVYALIPILWSASRPLQPKRLFIFCLVGATVFLAVFPYAIHYLKHPDYFNLQTKRFTDAPAALEGRTAQSLKQLSWFAKGSRWFTAGYEGVHGGNYAACAILFVPVLLFLFWRDPKSRLLVGTVLFILLLLPLKTGMGIAAKRTYFLLPILLPLSLAQGLRVFSRNGTLSLLIVVPSLLLGTVGLPSTSSISHVPTLASFFPGIYRRLAACDGHTILLETQALWIETDKGQRPEAFSGPHAHPELLLALETGKRFLSHGKDGYPFSVYRENCLMSGIWAGKFLTEFPVTTVNAFLEKWGVRYAVVWSSVAKRFFSGNPAYYESVFREGPWEIFRFKEADPASLVLPHGEGRVDFSSYTHITLSLKGVRRGDEAVLRMNYFPDFDAVSDGKPLALYSKEGQIAFKIPCDDFCTVVLRYPRYTVLYLLGLLGLLLLAILVWRET
ncbi:MAG: hypothetical protein ABH845_01290 [Candidatus Omnitrophota bacterium]